jgi:His-Xaa-Ser system protein HxsD
MPIDAEKTEVSFDRATVDLDALQRAAYAVADAMSVDITVSGDRFICTMYPRDHGADPSVLAHRMRTEVVDQTLRLRIAAETEPLRNLIFALAFSKTGLTEDEMQQ